MGQTNAEINKRRKIGRIFIVLIILITIFSINKVQAVSTNNTNVSGTRVNSSQVANTLDINNKEEVQDTITNYILTINSEGLTQSILSDVIELYTNLTESYSNEQIADMIDDCKGNLSEYGVPEENLDSVTTVLRNLNTTQTKEVLDKININEISQKLSNGESLQTIVNYIMQSMTATEKVDLVVSILLSANIIRTVLIVLLVIFVYGTLLRCVIYKKAGKHAWAPFIPIYRNVVMLKICGMSPWWLLLLLVPIVGWIGLWLVSVASKFMLAEKFGRGVAFSFGLWILAPIFETILVVSRKIQYIGNEEE